MVLAHSRINMQTAMRAAVVSFLQDQRPNLDIKLAIYPARPRHITAPHAFIDTMRERIDYTGLNQRQPETDVIVVYGLFDSLEAVTQRDRFVDALINWQLDYITGRIANSTIAIAELTDIPDYVPDWIPPETGEQRTYYASRITFRGLALTG